MKSINRNLHVDRKRIIFLSVCFSSLSFLLNMIVSCSTNTGFTQLNSLIHSKYIYSAMAQSPVVQDTYYDFNAGIYFAVSPSDRISLNADILMQANEVEYTDLVYWNTDQLDVRGVAVSRNIARENGLDVGDILYSKHIVDGTVYEYSIEQILPEAANVRVSEEKNYHNGIIIMGYDRLYSDNITHNCIVFTKASVDELMFKYSSMPENIVYRADEIMAVGKRLLPYLVLAGMLSVLNVTGLVFFLTRSIKYNFRRLIVLGFEKKALNSSYVKSVIGTGFLLILTTLFISAVIFRLVNLCQIEFVFLVILLLVEFAALLGSAIVMNRHLWRRG